METFQVKSQYDYENGTHIAISHIVVIGPVMDRGGHRIIAKIKHKDFRVPV